MFCQKCGKEILESDTVCIHCGTVQPTVKTTIITNLGVSKKLHLVALGLLCVALFGGILNAINVFNDDSMTITDPFGLAILFLLFELLPFFVWFIGFLSVLCKNASSKKTFAVISLIITILLLLFLLPASFLVINLFVNDGSITNLNLVFYTIAFLLQIVADFKTFSVK